MKKKASELAASGKFDEAKQVAARVLQMSPQDKTVLKNMAISSLDKAKQFVQNADFDKALQYGREALAYDGNNVEAKKMVDGLLVKAGIDPVDPEQRMKSADLLLSQGKNDEAFVEYQSALKLKPSAEAHVGIGNVALRAGQKERAKNEYHAAIDVDSNSALAYRQLGMLKLNAGDVVGANAALSRALVLNPKDKNASKSLVELWQQQVSKVPGANSHLGLARAYQLAGDLQSAQTEYRTVVQIEPENPHLPAARQAFKLALARQDAERAAEAGRTLEAHGAISDAYTKVHEAVRLAPGDADLRVYQGQLLEKLQRVPAARDAYLNALKINPRHGLAAERLRNLPPDSVTVAPELAVPPSQMFVPANGFSAASNGSAGKIGQTPTADPVANISNFAVALRNHMVVSKAQMEQVEDAAHGLLKQVGAAATAPSETLVTGAATTAGGAAAEIAGSAAPAVAAAADTSLTSSVSDALASAAAAIAAAKGKTAAPAAASAAAASAPAPVTAQNLLESKFPKMTSQVNSLQKQNQQLQAQLKKMNDSLAKMRGQQPAAAAAPEMTTTPASASVNNAALDNILSNNATVASGIAAPVETAFEPPLAPSIAQTIAGAQATTIPFPPAGLQAIAPEVDPAGLGTAPILQPIAVPNLVRLELENASPKLGSVELSVILRNDGNSSLPLSSNKLRAIINYSNRRPAEVKAQFVDLAVPPHGAIRGVIRVPFDKVDPTADLVIPELLPPGSPARDVHLITSMAYR
jgi:tetratricopeptide (TPR) repeat protein